MTRQDMLLQGLPKAARVIEIGPSFAPLAPKREGWNTFVIDHAGRDELVAKYAGHGQDTDLIEEVDFVWKGGSLADAVPADRHGTFDAFIASHVIEHTTDVVTFLQAAQTLVRPDGVVILAVPDKRKCFDFYRHPSTTADAIVAFEERRNRHDTRTHLAYGMHMALKGGAPAWDRLDTRPAGLLCGLDHLDAWRTAVHAGHYVDAHNWVFVPASFRLLILELGLTGFIDLRVERWQERPDTEFFAWLRRGAALPDPAAVQEVRRALMDRMLIELAEQTEQIPANPFTEKLAEQQARYEARLAHEQARFVEEQARLAHEMALSAYYRGRIDRMRSSLSWKITAPLRYLGRGRPRG